MWQLLALILLVPVFACGEDLISPSVTPESPPATSQPMTQRMSLDFGTLVNLVLTSGLVSSVASGGLLWWLTARKEQKQLLRTKLEELFMAHEGFCEVFEIRFLALITEIQYRPGRIDKYFEAHSGEAQPPQFFQQDSDQDEEQKRKCEMLVLLYFKEFLPQWKKMMSCRNQLVSRRFRRVALTLFHLIFAFQFESRCPAASAFHWIVNRIPDTP